MTKPERDRVAKIRFDLAQEGVTPERWKFEVLASGATVCFGSKVFRYHNHEIWGV